MKDKFEVRFPSWFDDFAEFEYEAKGFLLDIPVCINDKWDVFDFYDFSRFFQEAGYDIYNDEFLIVRNTILLKNVTKKEILKAIEKLASSKDN